jgi:hypothetical protein
MQAVADDFVQFTAFIVVAVNGKNNHHEQVRQYKVTEYCPFFSELMHGLP